MVIIGTGIDIISVKRVVGRIVTYESFLIIRIISRPEFPTYGIEKRRPLPPYPSVRRHTGIKDSLVICVPAYNVIERAHTEILLPRCIKVGFGQRVVRQEISPVDKIMCNDVITEEPTSLMTPVNHIPVFIFFVYR